MATIVRARIPAEEFALCDTFESLPDVHVECIRLVERGQTSVIPLLWVRRTERSVLETALASDPTVEDLTVHASFDGEHLCRMTWIDRVEVALQILTRSEATVMEAVGDAERWDFRVLYPTRSALSKTVDFCERRGLTFEVDHVRRMEDDPGGRYGLTWRQYEALTNAYRKGYFSVPRETSAAEIAADLGISQQALSERLRRGHEALIEDALILGRHPDGRE